MIAFSARRLAETSADFYDCPRELACSKTYTEYVGFVAPLEALKLFANSQTRAGNICIICIKRSRKNFHTAELVMKEGLILIMRSEITVRTVAAENCACDQ